MFRALLLSVLIFLISCASARSEDYATFHIGLCLDSSTVIIRGKILDEDGHIKVEEVLKGIFPSDHIFIQQLQDINQYGDYSPERKAGWEVIIFFKAGAQQGLIPVHYWENNSQGSLALGFGLSTLWCKDGSVFYAGFSAEDKAVFRRQGEQRAMEDLIKEHVQTEEALKRIEKYKSCTKKFKQLEKLYEGSNFVEIVYDAMVKTECGEQIVDFVRPTVLDSPYTYMQMKMLPGFVENGGQEIVPDLEAMYDKEFRFWKEYIGVPERRLWWHFDSTLQMRFAIFETLMRLIIENELGDWELHANQVIDYFGSLDAYRTNTGYGKMHETVQRWLQN